MKILYISYIFEKKISSYILNSMLDIKKVLKNYVLIKFLKLFFNKKSNNKNYKIKKYNLY